MSVGLSASCERVPASIPTLMRILLVVKTSSSSTQLFTAMISESSVYSETKTILITVMVITLHSPHWKGFVRP